MNKKLYVGNIPFDCHSEQLSGLFEQFGKVTECDVLGKYGFVVSLILFNNLNNLFHLGYQDLQGINLCLHLWHLFTIKSSI